MPEGKKVLLIDDSPMMLAMEQSFLEELPCSILTATAGPEGITMALEHRPDVVVLDKEMPGLEGHHVLHVLRNTPELVAVPVILVTARVTDSEMDRFINMGLTDFIMKPFEPDEIQLKVARALGLSDRKRLSFLVRLKAQDRTSHGRAMDLSTTGIRIECSDLFQVSERVSLRFYLPLNQILVKVTSVVVRQIPGSAESIPRLGLQFEDLDDLAKQAIEETLRGDERASSSTQ